MMSSPLLSIIIPHHNRPEMLSELLDSIPQREGIEILVVDDHSDLPLPDAGQHPSMRLIRLPEGERYAGSARNVGIDQAQGEWVVFADSDDLFASDALLRVVEMLPSRTCDLVYVQADSFRTDGAQGARHLSVNTLLRDAAQGDVDGLVQFYPPWCKFVRRELLIKNAIRFDTTRVSNDVMFSAKLFLAAESWESLEEVVYHVREGNESLTSVTSIASIEERLAVLSRYNDLLVEEGLRTYRVPAVGQLAKLLPDHPLAFVRLCISTRASGHPAFLTKRHVARHIRKRLGRK